MREKKKKERKKKRKKGATEGKKDERKERREGGGKAPLPNHHPVTVATGPVLVSSVFRVNECITLACRSF